jgi:hypothetical protein
MAQQADLPPLPPLGEETDANKKTRSGRLDELGSVDLACLIINKMIGTGIYVTPATVALLVQNKVAAMVLWGFGGLYSYLRSV